MADDMTDGAHVDRALWTCEEAVRALESLAPASDRRSRLDRERLRMEARRAGLWCERIAPSYSGARKQRLFEAARRARQAAK
jgi:hypothetical protein